jgi:hypothetical protein
MTTSIANELKTLVGLRCWGIVGGRGNGSMVTFHLGTKLARHPPLKNRHLPKTLQRFQGEYCLFVKGCAWRLETNSRIVCASTDPEPTIGLELTRRLTGATITKTCISTWAGDASVTFNDEYLLSLFCDQTEENGIDNYAVRFPSGWIKVGPNSVQSTAPA